jgi:hypothetical protein
MATLFILFITFIFLTTVFSYAFSKDYRKSFDNSSFLAFMIFFIVSILLILF